MNRLGFAIMVFAALALGTVHCPAQSTAAQQNGPPDQGGPRNQGAAAVIQSNARLVVLDVIVTDGHGRAVPGLALRDFVLRENGAAQTLKSLDDHTSGVGGGVGTMTAAEPALPKGTYSNHPPAQSDVWNVLALDQLNSSREDQARTRQQILQFAKTLPAGVPVSLVVISASSVKVVVPFTLSGAAIEKALSGKDASPADSPLLDVYNADDRAAFGRLELTRMDMRVEQTLRALDGLARWVSQYPGKKNLYWLSSGFPLTAGRTSRNPDDPGASDVYRRAYLRLQQESDKQLESARVAVFPIDVRGNPGAAREGIDTPDVEGSVYAKLGGGIKYNDDLNQYDGRVNESQAGMVEMANATGGVATMNRNNIADILSDQFQQAERFYTLSYSPSNSDWNGEYRKIDLALTKRGYKLYYRHGYFASDAAGQGRSPSPEQNTGQNTVDAFSLAMRYGARLGTAVLFTTRVDRGPDSLTLDSSIDLHTLSLAPGDSGRQVASIDCAVVEYDDVGKVLGTSQFHADTRLKPGQVEQLAGLPAQQKIPLAAGARWVVVGIRDHESGKFGTLQIPLDQPPPI